MSEIPDQTVPVPYRVRRRVRNTHDTVTLELEAEHGRAQAAGSFAPGQFNMLYVFGLGEAPISISGDPAATGTLVHTVRAVGPVSRALRGARRGAVVGVRGPFGSAWPLEQIAGRDVVVMAGGIGLAPLRPRCITCSRTARATAAWRCSTPRRRGHGADTSGSPEASSRARSSMPRTRRPSSAGRRS